MAKREVTVVINGEEYVSKAADSAGKGLDNLGKKIPGISALATRAAAAYAAIAEAIRMVGDKISSSLRAYDELNASHRKLEGTAKLLGVSQQYMLDIVSEGQKKFGLSRTVATDYAAEIAKLATQSGNAGSAQELLASFLDLAAARGLNASEALNATRLSIAQIDDGTDKLFAKNPSVIWDDFAKVIGRSASKFDDQDKAAALAFATLAAGIKVGGSYQAYLDSSAGKQDLLNQRMIEAEASFGAALQPVRLLTMELGTSLMPALGPLARILGGALAAAVVTVAKVFNILYGSVGFVVEGLGKLTGSKAMEDWGRSAVATANALGTKLNEAGEAAGRAIRGVDNEVKASEAAQKVVENKRAETIAAMAKLVEDAKKREGTAHKDSAKEADKAFKDYIAAARATFEMLNAAVISNEDVLKRLEPQMKKSFDRIHIDNANQAVNALRTATDDFVNQTFAGVEVNVSGWDKLRLKIKEAGFSVETAARATIDFAQSFGLMDRNTASTLTSVVNIGAAVKEMAKTGFSFAGVTGVLGGVANIVSGMMAADAERRRLLRENNVQLQKLREEGISLTNKVSGEKLSKVSQALLASGFQNKEFFADKERSVMQALADMGLTLRDLESVADEFGIKGIFKNGKINDFVALRQLVEALTNTGAGKIPQSFADQMQFFRDTQRIGGSDGVQSGKDLIEFLKNVGGVSALNGIDLSDPNSAFNALFALRTRLNNGGIAQSQFGKLTGSQFQSILAELLDLFSPRNGSGSGGESGGGTSTGNDGPTETPEQKAKREREEARQRLFEDIDLREINAEDRLSFLRRQKQTDEVKAQIAAVEQLLRDLSEERESLRRRFRREDITGQYGPMPVPSGTSGTTDVGTGTSNIVTGGSTSAPAETIQSVIKAMDTNLASILTSHTTIHERIAAATEGSYQRLTSIDAKMDELIVVTAGQIEATDAKLEAMRRMAALERGERQVFG